MLRKIGFIGRALRHRNYRLFFSGQILSLIGSWLSVVATSWLVYRLCRETMPEKSAMMLGIVGFVGQIPVFVVAPFAGVWVDRLNRHKILVITQFLSMLQSFALAYLALKQIITIPHVLILSAFQGFVNALDMPARQAFVIEIVDDRKDLGNAIALNSSMVHTARLVGPSIAGFLIYHFGEGYCFLIDGISYFAVLSALLMMKVNVRVHVHTKSMVHELKEGVAYAWKSPPIRALLYLTATASLMFTSQSVLMPIVADKVLGGNERTLGFLLGASGAGALSGALYLASRESVVGLGRVVFFAVLTLGLALIGFALSKTFLLSVFVLYFVGGSTVLLMASCNTILQTIVDEDKRGRVMSLFGMAFLGMMPFGSLGCGWLAAGFGTPVTFGFCGFVCLVAAFRYYKRLPVLREHIRPIYESRGLIKKPLEIPTH